MNQDILSVSMSKRSNPFEGDEIQHMYLLEGRDTDKWMYANRPSLLIEYDNGTEDRHCFRASSEAWFKIRPETKVISVQLKLNSY